MKVHPPNRILHLICLVLPALLLLIFIFVLALSFPAALGNPPPEYQLQDTREFDQKWSLSLNGTRIHFSDQGGTVSKAFAGEKMKGALFWGENSFHLSPGDVPEKAEGLFVSLEEEQLLFQRGDDLAFTPVENPERRKPLPSIENSVEPPVFEGAGVSLSFLPSGNSFYQYYFNQEGEKIAPVHYQGETHTPWVAGIIYFLTFIILILITLAITLNYGNHFPPFRFNLSLADFFRAIAALAISFFSLHVTLVEAWPQYYAGIGYALAVAVIILTSRFSSIPFYWKRIHHSTWKNGLFQALLIAALFLHLPFELVKGVEGISWFALIIKFLLVFLVASLFHELVWRGYLQILFSTLWGNFWGLVATSLLAGMFHFFLFYLHSPHLLGYPYSYLNLIVLAPGTALVLGLLFQRTGNVLSNALLHAIIFFLPPYLSY